MFGPSFCLTMRMFAERISRNTPSSMTTYDSSHSNPSSALVSFILTLAFLLTMLRPAMEAILAEEDSSSALFDRVFSLIFAMDGVPESADELEDFYIKSPQKKDPSAEIGDAA